VELVLTPIKEKYVVEQGQTFPTFFWLENIGNGTVENVSISPVLPNDLWRNSLTLVDEINPGEKLNRTLMFELDANVEPGIYVIPVRAIAYGETADITYITIDVRYGKNLARMEIVESPPEVEINSEANLTIPIYIKNIGKKDLHNVVGRLENIEQCLDSVESGSIDINVSESSTLNIVVRSKKGPKTCDSLLILSSKEKAYAFAQIKINVKPEPPLLPLKGQLTPIIALAWTLILVLYTVLRKRRMRRGELTPSKSARLIVYMLLLGELLILLYLTLWAFGVVEMI